MSKVQFLTSHLVLFEIKYVINSLLDQTIKVDFLDDNIENTIIPFDKINNYFKNHKKI
jgi:hypothetical protein